MRIAKSIFSLQLLLVVILLFCGCALEKGASVSDPLEGFNRKVFWFNTKADTYVLEPIAKVYDQAVPDLVQRGTGNFFDNLTYPKVLVSSLLQLKFEQAYEQTLRFFVNSTLGFLGIFDPATDMGLMENNDDFGVALGYQGMGEGPYLVLPIVGPSNFRDALGRVVDMALDPLFFVDYFSLLSSPDTATINSATALKYVDMRAGLLEAVDTAKDSSLDLYLFSQGAYHQYRQGLIYDGMAPDEEFVE